MEDYEVFKMPTRIGAGYGERYDIRTVTGYWSWRKHGKMGIEGDLRTKNDCATFWEQHDFITGESRIEQGDYAEVKRHIYVFVEDDDFGTEGGFTRWTVQRVAGNTDQQITNTKVDEVIRNDYE
jgi:hypothetical protein